MKRVIVWVGVILITFTFGIVATLGWLKFNERPIKIERVTEDLPILEVCELVNNPEKYNGKKVSIIANLYFYDHGFFLEDRNCRNKDENSRTAMFYNESWRIAINFNKENSNKIFKELEGIKNTNKPFILVGNFKKIGESEFFGDSIQGRTQLHFEIIKIKKVH